MADAVLGQQPLCVSSPVGAAEMCLCPVAIWFGREGESAHHRRSHRMVAQLSLLGSNFFVSPAVFASEENRFQRSSSQLPTQKNFFALTLGNPELTPSALGKHRKHLR
jgi:hypothetical protein